jgi:hypothetical protein
MYGGLQVLEVRVRFKNATNQPLMLGYVGNSGVATDAYGGRYTIAQTAFGDGVKGIGVVQRGEADSQFVLAPGATGDAVFTLSRHRAQDKRDPIGTEFSFDLSAARSGASNPSDRTVRGMRLASLASRPRSRRRGALS